MAQEKIADNTRRKSLTTVGKVFNINQKYGGAASWFSIGAALGLRKMNSGKMAAFHRKRTPISWI
jgi:hypothetical protein